MISLPGSQLRGLDRKYWPDQCDQAGTCGLVTAADEAFRRELLLLIESIHRHTWMTVVVFDLGLSAATIGDLQKYERVTVRPIDVDRSIGDHWQAWWKPLYLSLSPFDFTLWVDADCVVLGQVDPIFALITDVPVLIADAHRPDQCYNPPQLYVRLPTQSRSDEVVNSGVVGLRKGRDDRLLQEWLGLVQKASADPSLRDLLRWWDQGALLWAIQELELSHLINYNTGWNCPARRQLYQESDHLLDQLETDNPGATIIHFTDLKISQLLEWGNQRVVDYHSSGMFVRPGRVRAFVTGPECAAVGTLATALRAGSDDFSIVRYNAPPTLAADAYLLSAGRTPGNDLVDKFMSYERPGCALLVEANTRLLLFLHRLVDIVPDSRIVVLWRRPSQLVEWRLRHGCHWPQRVHELPIFYQRYLAEKGTTELDRCRPTPPDDLTLLECHVWELHYTLSVLLRQVTALPREQFLLCDAGKLPDQLDQVVDFIDPAMFDLDRVRESFAAWRDDTPGPVADWAAAMVRSHAARIDSLLLPIVEQIKLKLEPVINLVP